MTRLPILLPEARDDIANAFQWYEGQSLGLGLEFLRSVEAALQSIQRMPLSHAVVHECYRRALLRKFPFVLFYEVDEGNDRCVVYSVFHCSQEPAKWRVRLP